MGNRGLARTAVLEISKEQVPEVPNEVPGEVSNRSSDPPRHATPPGDELAAFYAAALLKLTVELRRAREPGPSRRRFPASSKARPSIARLFGGTFGAISRCCAGLDRP